MTHTSNTHRIAWQGWSVNVPADWNPVRIEGDHARGTLLLADLHRPRLGLHWTKLPRRTAVAAALDGRLCDEVGRLAAARSRPAGFTAVATGRLYRDPDPPGRDVFVGRGEQSGRLLTVVYHAAERSDRLAEVLGTLADTSPGRPTHWCVFDFAFTTPAGWRLRAERLHAGDLAFLFDTPGRRAVVLRQIAPATLALSRQPLAEWMRTLPFTTPKFYRQHGRDADATLTEFAPELIGGLARTLRRKRRLRWAWFVPRTQVVLAVRDPHRDRLLIGHGGDQDALGVLLTSAIRS